MTAVTAVQPFQTETKVAPFDLGRLQGRGQSTYQLNAPQVIGSVTNYGTIANLMQIQKGAAIVTIVGKSALACVTALAMKKGLGEKAILSLYLMKSETGTTTTTTGHLDDSFTLDGVLMMTDATLAQLTLWGAEPSSGLILGTGSTKHVLASAWKSELVQRARNVGIHTYIDSTLADENFKYFTSTHPTTTHLIFTEPCPSVWGKKNDLNIHPDKTRETVFYWMKWSIIKAVSLPHNHTSTLSGAIVRVDDAAVTAAETGQERWSIQVQLTAEQFTALLAAPKSGGVTKHERKLADVEKLGSNLLPATLDAIYKSIGLDPKGVTASDQVWFFEEKVHPNKPPVQVFNNSIIYLIGDAAVSHHSATGGEVLSLMREIQSMSEWIAKHPHPVLVGKSFDALKECDTFL